MLLEQKETLFKSHRKTICYYHKDGPKPIRYLNGTEGQAQIYAKH